MSPGSFDGQGDYSLGVKEQIIFPEIQYDQVDQIRGVDITITTTATDDRHGRALLEAFQLPVPEVQDDQSHGEDEHGRAREASRRDREEVRSAAREAQGADPQPQELAEERQAAQAELQAQPRDAAKVRHRNRCAITGRSRGRVPRVRGSRVKIREVASRGGYSGTDEGSSW